MTREENPRDRHFNPEPETSDYRDRTEFGPEPVDETEDTIREPEAHRPRPADEDLDTSEAIANEGARSEGNPGTSNTSSSGRAAVTHPEGGEDTVAFGAVPVRTSGEAGNEAERAGGTPAEADRPVGGRDESRLAAPGPVGDIGRGGPLLPSGDADQIRTRWHELQAGFVDDPRKAVEEAAQLVSHATDRVTAVLTDQLGALDEGRSAGTAVGDESATEQLRTLMQRYHVLLDRMLAV